MLNLLGLLPYRQENFQILSSVHKLLCHARHTVDRLSCLDCHSVAASQSKRDRYGFRIDEHAHGENSCQPPHKLPILPIQPNPWLGKRSNDQPQAKQQLNLHIAWDAGMD